MAGRPWIRNRMGAVRRVQSGLLSGYREAGEFLEGVFGHFAIFRGSERVGPAQLPASIPYRFIFL